jgi:hypothetical protein
MQPSELIRKAFESIAAVDRGEYCECADPVSLGMVCETCERRIKAEEIRKVVEIVGCHDFIPDVKRFAPMCAVCTMWEDDGRHKGSAAVGKTSWGQRLVPVRVDADNLNVGGYQLV